MEDDGLCGDSALELFDLEPGTYTLALTAYFNEPGFFDDPDPCFCFDDILLSAGFTGGGDLDGRTASFAVDVIQSPVPEPATLLLVGGGVVASLRKRRVGAMISAAVSAVRSHLT